MAHLPYDVSRCVGRILGEGPCAERDTCQRYLTFEHEKLNPPPDDAWIMRTIGEPNCKEKLEVVRERVTGKIKNEDENNDR